MNRNDHIFAVRIEVALQLESMPRHELAAIAFGAAQHRRQRFLLHSNLRRAVVVLKNLLDFGGLF